MFPEPTDWAPSQAAVFLNYLYYYRAVIIDKVAQLPTEDLRHSRLSSGWTPLELLNHLTHVERRWLEWGFQDPDLPDPWGDQVDGRWHVLPERSLDDLTNALRSRGERTRQIVRSHTLTDVGRPGQRWGAAPPATLERVLFHLLQEYARTPAIWTSSSNSPPARPASEQLAKALQAGPGTPLGNALTLTLERCGTTVAERVRGADCSR